MHKVVNTTNEVALQALAKLLIRPLLGILVSAKRDGKPLQSCQKFSKLKKKSRTVIQAALRQLVAKKGITFEIACNAVVKDCSLHDLQRAERIYNEQTKALEKGSYAISFETLPKGFKQLFANCLYEKLFDNKAIWMAAVGERLTRPVFHKNFREDNLYPSTCPYCDLDTMNSSGTHIVEHFLPKAKFPLISLHPKNLFSACHGCNMPTGKGAKVFTTVTSPYVDEIGELVEFSFNTTEKKIKIQSIPSRNDVDGFLKLTSLPTRYANENTWRQFDGRERAFHETVQGRAIANLPELMRYLELTQRGAVLTYAMKHRVRQLHSAGYVF